MSHDKSVNYEEIAKHFGGFFGYISEFIEKIGDQDPYPIYNETAAKLSIIQRKMNTAKSPFLKKEYVQDLYDDVLGIIINWNKDISKNVKDYVDAYLAIGKKSNSKKDNYNPMKTIIEERERFLSANTVFEQVLRKINRKMVEEVDLYALFFALITSHEVMEKILHGEIERGLKKYDIKDYDLVEMFSVTGKWKDKDGVLKTDTKVIRNALSHFDFKLKSNKIQIVFNTGPKSEEITRTFTLRGFFKFVSNSRFLLQTFYVALSVLVSFTILRRFYVIKDT